MNINELREKVKNGDFDDNELIDLVLYLERENQVLLEENKKYKEVIDKAIELLNNPWTIESGNKEVDEITHQKKIELIKLLEDKEE